MYVPPDEPVQETGEINMTFQQDGQGGGVHMVGVDQGVDMSHGAARYEPGGAISAINPIYQRSVLQQNMSTFTGESRTIDRHSGDFHYQGSSANSNYEKDLLKRNKKVIGQNGEVRRSNGVVSSGHIMAVPSSSNTGLESSDITINPLYGNTDKQVPVTVEREDINTESNFVLLRRASESPTGTDLRSEVYNEIYNTINEDEADSIEGRATLEIFRF